MISNKFPILLIIKYWTLCTIQHGGLSEFKPKKKKILIWFLKKKSNKIYYVVAERQLDCEWYFCFTGIRSKSWLGWNIWGKKRKTAKKYIEKACNYAQSFFLTNTFMSIPIQPYYNFVPPSKTMTSFRKYCWKNLLLGYVFVI